MFGRTYPLASPKRTANPCPYEMRVAAEDALKHRLAADPCESTEVPDS